VTGDLLDVEVRADLEGVLVLALTGEVDLSTAPILAKGISELLAVVTDELLIVDLTGVGFLASAGMSALLAGREQAEQRGVAIRIVVTPAAAAYRALEIAGLLEILPIYPTVPAAAER
jgi:anti-sigma B factor antagonist